MLWQVRQLIVSYKSYGIILQWTGQLKQPCLSLLPLILDLASCESLPVVPSHNFRGFGGLDNITLAFLDPRTQIDKQRLLQPLQTLVADCCCGYSFYLLQLVYLSVCACAEVTET
jgi:hypothetical protein